MENKEPKKRVTIWLRKPVLKGSQHVAVDKELSLSELIEQLLEREMQSSSGRRVREQQAPYATAGQ